MSTASGGSSWCHGWLCMSEQGLGWLITAEGCRAGFGGGRCLESSGAFHISAMSKNSFDVLPGLLWCSRSVWQTLPLSLSCLKTLLAHLPSVVDRTSPVRKISLVSVGLWKIYNRWALFEGYIFSNYVFAVWFGWVVSGLNGLWILACCLPALCSMWIMADS